MKSGFISIIGRTNVGKSTFLNNVIGEKISITANKVQTTRNRILGIHNIEDDQLVFIDTPGIHKPKNNLSKKMNDISKSNTLEADIILLMVDTPFKEGLGDDFIIKSIKDIKKPKFLLINKIDLFNKDDLIKTLKYYEDSKIFDEVFTLRADKNLGISEIVVAIRKLLKEDIKYFPDDVKSDKSDEFMISEIIREKIIHKTKDEIPHQLYVTVNLKDEKKLLRVNATIYTLRDSHKKILIGKNGLMLKAIGTKARIEIENTFDTKVFLDLTVKVRENWTNNEFDVSSITKG